MAEMPEALKRKLAEVGEKYGAAISAMADRELVSELERRALMASFSYQDPTTSMMLKLAKTEILRRLKGGEAVKAEEKPEEAPRPTLFG